MVNCQALGATMILEKESGRTFYSISNPERFFFISNCTHVQQDFYFHNHVYGIESIFEVIHLHILWYSRKRENITHCQLSTVRKEIL